VFPALSTSNVQEQKERNCFSPLSKSLLMRALTFILRLRKVRNTDLSTESFRSVVGIPRYVARILVYLFRRYSGLKSSPAVVMMQNMLNGRNHAHLLPLSYCTLPPCPSSQKQIGRGRDELHIHM